MQKSRKSKCNLGAIAIVCLATIAAPALAGHNKHNRSSHTGFAKVTDIDPVYETISRQVPERSCRMQTRHESANNYRSYTPTVLGTLIGGALGNELGHSKTNKKVGTVVGGVLGATLARDWSHRGSASQNRRRAVEEEICETNYHTQYQENVVGYNVTYRYQGQSYQTRMNHRPGKRIKVAVRVTPVDQ